MFKMILLTVMLLFSFTSLSHQDNKNEIGQVVKLLHDAEGIEYVITTTGTWMVKEQTLVRLQDNHQLPISVLPPRTVGGIWSKNELESFVYIVSVFLLAFVFLYYQSSLNRRRRRFYEKIKVQQNLLSIALMATGDEVSDCDIKAANITKINPNAKLLLDDELYFTSDNYTNRIHEEERGLFIAKFDGILKGSSNNYELLYRRNDHNQWIWIAERGSVIERDQDGRAIRLVTSMRDVTDIMHEQQHLIELTTELEKRLRRLQASQE